MCSVIISISFSYVLHPSAWFRNSCAALAHLSPVASFPGTTAPADGSPCTRCGGGVDYWRFAPEFSPTPPCDRSMMPSRPIGGEDGARWGGGYHTATWVRGKCLSGSRCFWLSCWRADCRCRRDGPFVLFPVFYILSVCLCVCFSLALDIFLFVP